MGETILSVLTEMFGGIKLKIIIKPSINFGSKPYQIGFETGFEASMVMGLNWSWQPHLLAMRAAITAIGKLVKGANPDNSCNDWTKVANVVSLEIQFTPTFTTKFMISCKSVSFFGISLKDMKKAFDNAGKEIKKVAKKVGKAIKDVADKVGKGLKNAGKALHGVATRFFSPRGMKDLHRTFHRTWNKMGKALNKVGNVIKDFFGRRSLRVEIEELLQALHESDHDDLEQFLADFDHEARLEEEIAEYHQWAESFVSLSDEISEEEIADRREEVYVSFLNVFGGQEIRILEAEAEAEAEQEEEVSEHLLAEELGELFSGAETKEEAISILKEALLKLE